MSGGFAALDQVLHGIEAALAAGLAPVKLNAVIERGVNDHTALDLLERFRGSPRDRALHRIHGCRQSQ
jgi:GTP 3',8-cyclase